MLARREQPQEARRGQRKLQIANADRVRDRIGDAYRRAHRISFRDPLGAERGDRRERLAVQHDQIGHHARGWYGIIGKASGKKTAAFVVNKSFIEGGADRHRKSAAHLAVE